MGLAKLHVDARSLVTMLLDDSETRQWKMSNSEDLPPGSKVVQLAMDEATITFTVTHPDLAEPDLGFDFPLDHILGSTASFVSAEVTEDQQLRLDRYERELRHLMALADIGKSLSLADFNIQLTQLATRVVAVLRHEDPDEVIRVSGVQEVKIGEAPNNQPE